MLVQIRHEKPYGKRFEVWHNDKKLKSGEEYDLPADKLDLTFSEYNPVLSRFWFLQIFINFIVGLISASFDDFKDARRMRTVIRVRLYEIQDDEITIRFTHSGTSYEIEGAARSEETENAEIPLQQIKKRIKAYKIGIIAISLAILAAIAAALCLTLI